MKLDGVRKNVASLLADSSISDHQKDILSILLPSMKEEPLLKLYEVLNNEKEQMKKLDKKAERIVLKYNVMMENLVKAQEKDKKKNA